MTPVPVSLRQDVGKPRGGEILNPEFEILCLSSTETPKEDGEWKQGPSTGSEGLYTIPNPLHEVSPYSQSTQVSPGILRELEKGMLPYAGGELQSLCCSCPFSCPFLIKENLKPPPPPCALCPLSFLGAPSFSWSRQCPKTAPKFLGSAKGYLPGCDLTSPWVLSSLRSLELCWRVVRLCL